MRPAPRSRKASSPAAASRCSTPARRSAGLNPENDDQKVGIDIVRRALQAPARQIFANAGADGSVVVGKLLEKGDANHGFDAQRGTYVDMVKAGIIDPTKVVRLALQGAASSPACSSPPRRWSPRSRRGACRRCPTPAWAARTTEAGSEVPGGPSPFLQNRRTGVVPWPWIAAMTDDF